jgi:molecular chaperone GrpE
MNAHSQPDPDPRDASAAQTPHPDPSRPQDEPIAGFAGDRVSAFDTAATDQSFVDIAEQPAPDDSDAAFESRDEAMQRMMHEVEQARQRVLIAQAELENFRKRTRKDYEEQLRFAALPLVEDLLQVRDNLVRAIEAAESSDASTAGLKDGVQLVAKQFDDALTKHGIKPITAVGEVFDPNYHQAISQMPSQEHAQGVVAIEATTGFQMHQRVVRPSQVVVSTGPPTAG